MFGDAEKFKTADADGNGVLDRTEYPAFIHPYDYDFMHDVELKLLLRQYDKNGDGVIDFREYMTQPGQSKSFFCIPSPKNSGRYTDATFPTYKEMFLMSL